MIAVPDLVALALIGGVAAGVGVIAATLLRLRAERERVVTERAPAPIADRRTRRLDDVLASSSTLRRAVQVTANLADRRGALGSVERSLRAADVPVRPAELILGHIVATVVLPVVVLLATQSIVWAGLALLLAGVSGPGVLRFLVARRLKRFSAQLPDALTSLSGALRAGRSIGQAMEALSRDLPDPIGREFRKVVAEVRLGRSLNETLNDAADRVGSEDFRWAVLAMHIQSEVGGNLAELLDQVAATMRERSRMRAEVKALTAEGRASALMLVILVPSLGGAMSVLNPEYMKPLFTTGSGQTILGVSTLMIVGGYLWMNSMVKIDV